MSKQLISVSFGKETFSSNSASFSAFVVDAPFTRELPSKRFKRQGSVQRFPVSPHPDVNGYMYLDSLLDVPDGSIICVQAQHRFKGSPIRDGAVFVCLRNTGPLITIHAALAASTEATLTGDFLVFQGRGDVLSLAELEAYGITPPKNYVAGFMDPQEVAECYDVAEVAPEHAPKPRFEVEKTSTGEKVLLPQRARRQLSLRRRD